MPVRIERIADDTATVCTALPCQIPDVAENPVMCERLYVDDEGFVVLCPSVNRVSFVPFRDTRAELNKLFSAQQFLAFELLTKGGYVASVKRPADSFLDSEGRIHVAESDGWEFVVEIADLQGFRFVDSDSHQKWIPARMDVESRISNLGRRN